MRSIDHRLSNQSINCYRLSSIVHALINMYLRTQLLAWMDFLSWHTLTNANDSHEKCALVHVSILLTLIVSYTTCLDLNLNDDNDDVVTCHCVTLKSLCK